jgi:hypothetical protein
MFDVGYPRLHFCMASKPWHRGRAVEFLHTHPKYNGHQARGHNAAKYITALVETGIEIAIIVAKCCMKASAVRHSRA